MSTQLSKLQFGSFLTYCPRGNSDKNQNSRDVMLALKNDKFMRKPPIPMTQLVAERIQQNITKLPFTSFFQPNTILVPTPTSSLMQRDTLWVPQRIALALVKVGLGKEVVPCLKRVKPLRKAHRSPSRNRPRAAEHYESMMIQSSLSEPDEIVLVDDIVTQGATFMGAANRLASAFPRANIRAFAVIRTISRAHEFKKIRDPCIGTITLLPSGRTQRRP